MNPLTSNPLTGIPSHIRVGLYWAGYVLGVLSQGTTIVWASVAAASPDVAMPLWLLVASALVAFLQTQLNLLAGSNVSDPSGVVLEATVEQTGPASADVTLHGPSETADLGAAMGRAVAEGIERGRHRDDEHGHSSSTLLFWATSVPVALALVAFIAAGLLGRVS